MLKVRLKLAAAFLIHPPGIPITRLGLALSTPVGPDPELGVAEPVRGLVLL